MTTRSRRFSLPLTILFATSVLLVRLPLATQAATFQIVNLDGPGEGFNDPTPAATVGGNPGTTVGEQRMNVFLEAASQWGAVLESSEIIWVAAAFDDLICTEFTAILGSSSAVAVVKDFPEEEFTDTWYPVALANARAGLDFSPGGNDIIITFNSQLNGDPTCLQGSGWYYGLDHNDFSDFDLLVVTMHEFAHGLGFAEYVDRLSGAMLLGSPDVYSQFVFDKTASQFWPAMSNPERLSSMTNDGNVLWSGSEVAAEALVLESSGVDTSLDPDLFFPRLYAPVSVAAGSSISHWDATTCFIPELGIDVACPDQLMEPFIDLPSAVVGDFTQNLADELMTDVGWPATPVAASCGNNTTEGVEACDGTDLNGTTCANFGCTGDALACQNDCTAFNTVACTDCPVCDNDFVCETGEDCINCPTDCVGGTSTTAFCGNGICEAGDGENCLNCADDCNGKQNGRPRDRFCCGDGACEGAEDNTNCAIDCP